MDKVLKTMRFPKFLVLLLFVEMLERFSYCGMQSLLVPFLTSSLNYSDVKAYTVYSLFIAICYVGPVLGGFLADRLAGFRNMVILGSILLIIGHAFLILVKLDPELIYLGLGLIAIGSGLFKGNTTNLLGLCYKENDQERTRGFTLFYTGINLGPAIAYISCSYIAYLYGWHYGFSISGFCMVLGLIIFIKFQHLLGDNGVSPRPELMNKKILGISIFNVLIVVCFFLAFIVARMLASSEFFANIITFLGFLALSLSFYIIIKSSPLQRKGLIVLLIMAWFQMCFFALAMQLGSLINLFTRRNVVNNVFGLTVPSSAFQSIDSISIIIFGLLIGAYTKFSKRYATAKFTFGIFTMAICFFILYIGCLNANIDGKVNYLYLVVAMVFMGLGELFIVPLISEQITVLTPKHIRGLVMGIMMLSIAFSNLGGIIISKFMSVTSINGEIDNTLRSLEIYKAGFLKITLFNLVLVVLFLPCYPFVNRVINAEK